MQTKKYICNKLLGESTCDDCENCKVWEEQIKPVCEEIKSDTLKRVLPILLHIVYTEGCTYGFDKEIDELEAEYEELFGEPFKLTE